MQKVACILFLLYCSLLFGQKSSLAESYFKKGEYEKAIMLLKPLHQENPIRQDYFKKLLICYQQIEKYEFADELLKKQLQRYPQQEPILDVEIGYNLELQGNTTDAKIYYEKAISFVKTNASYGYTIGQTFRQNHLLNYALQAYQIAKSINPKLNTEISEAQIYGEKGDLENMFNSYLDLIDKNEKYYASIQRYIATFISEDSENHTNKLFKNLLLKRAQNNPKDAWNMLLSWLYMQQKEYSKAFVQEKSLYKRKPDSLNRIQEVGTIALENNDYKTANTVFQFILENANNEDDKIAAKIYLLKIENKLASTTQEFEAIDYKFQNLIANSKETNSKIEIELAYANFLSFTYNQPKKAIKILEEALPLANSKFQKGLIQLELGDVLVYTNQFNQALILYSQIQSNLKNSTIAQEARFKVAKTSYYKGDFKWAQVQLKVLKSSTSQLIANDALELNLLISNNIAGDSIQNALKNYAKAELLAYQNKDLEAVKLLDSIVSEFKEHPIEDDALFLQAKLYTKLGEFGQAEQNYLKIRSSSTEELLLDDATFYLAELYKNNLNNPEKAKEMYQKIIFEYPSSIYLVDARKNFRKLRGDQIP